MALDCNKASQLRFFQTPLASLLLAAVAYRRTLRVQTCNFLSILQAILEHLL